MTTILRMMLNYHDSSRPRKLLLARLHLLVTIVLVTILALSHLNRVKRNIMISAHIGVANHIELQIMSALGEQELCLDGDGLGHGNLLDEQELTRCGVPNDHPPVGQLLARVEGSDNILVVVIIVFIDVTRKVDLENDRHVGLVVALDQVVGDVERGISVDEGCNVAPNDRLVLTRSKITDLHLSRGHLQELVAIGIFHFHDIVDRLDVCILATLENLSLGLASTNSKCVVRCSHQPRNEEPVSKATRYPT